MRQHARWTVGLAVAGTVASLVVVGLLWLTLTHPVLVAQTLARGL